VHGGPAQVRASAAAKAQAEVDAEVIGDDDFSPVPLLGVTAGVLIFTTIANVRAPPPPYIEAWPHRKRCGPGEGARSGAEAEREIAE
jgi:hypothetical protein